MCSGLGLQGDFLLRYYHCSLDHSFHHPDVHAEASSGEGQAIISPRSILCFIVRSPRCLFISFDLNAGNGRAIETLMNGRKAHFTEPLSMGDKIELFWK